MHIKHIHDMIEKLSECAKVEIEKGIENVDTKEMGEVADIIKDLAEAEYYAKISKAMDEAEYGEDYDYMGAYDDGRRGYRGQPRDSMGRYTSRRRGGRRMGYEEPPYYHMTPDMYHDWDNMTEAERMRDLDITHGRMGYSNSSSMGGSSNFSERNTSNFNNGMGSSEGKNSRYENARRGYEEKKTMGADKQEKMKSLEEYMKTIAEELTQAVEGASPEERAMIKAKLNTVATKM